MDVVYPFASPTNSFSCLSAPTAAKQNGFTLIELLVVIVIVFILAALTLAGLADLKRTAQRNVCASNKRQVWQGTLLYTQDNKGFLPSSAASALGPDTINGLSTGDKGTIARKLVTYIPDTLWVDPDPVNYASSHLEGSSLFGSIWKKVGGFVESDEKFNPYNRNVNDSRGHRLAALAQPQLVGVMDCQDVPTAMGDERYPHRGLMVRLYADGRIEFRK